MKLLLNPDPSDTTSAEENPQEAAEKMERRNVANPGLIEYGLERIGAPVATAILFAFIAWALSNIAGIIPPLSWFLDWNQDIEAEQSILFWLSVPIFAFLILVSFDKSLPYIKPQKAGIFNDIFFGKLIGFSSGVHLVPLWWQLITDVDITPISIRESIEIPMKDGGRFIVKFNLMSKPDLGLIFTYFHLGENEEDRRTDVRNAVITEITGEISVTTKGKTSEQFIECVDDVRTKIEQRYKDRKAELEKKLGVVLYNFHPGAILPDPKTQEALNNRFKAEQIKPILANLGGKNKHELDAALAVAGVAEYKVNRVEVNITGLENAQHINVMGGLPIGGTSGKAK